jgi:hypothetical protein
MAGWPTPNCGKRGPENRESKDKRKSGGIDLQSTALIAGWATPTVQDGKNCAGPSQWDRNSWPLNVQAAATGQIAFLSPSETEKRGVLNPDFLRWLMGYPEEWGKYAPTGTP